MEPISLFIVDDHALFREGLKRLLLSTGEIKVVGEADNGAQFVAQLPIKADVVLMDIDMPLMNGMEASKRGLAEDPQMRIIALSMHSEQEYYFRMVEAGVKGFLLKSCDFDEVTSAIHIVAEGGNYFSQELLRSLVNNLRQTEQQQRDDKLSEREKEILILVCQGLSNQEIADKLFISKRTVDRHRAALLDKTESRNTAELVVYAIKNKLVKI